MTIKDEPQDETIHDTIRAAMSEPDGQQTTDEPAAISDRDSNGRFKPKNPPVEDVDAAAAEPVAQSTWDSERPPSSWTPKAREKWASLDPEIRAEITRREENSATGVQKLKEQHAPVDQFINNLRPYMVDFASTGENPNQHLFDVLQQEKTLRAGDLPSKFNALLAMADKYAIPLRDIINASVGQEILTKPGSAPVGIPDEYRREIEDMRSWREQQEQRTVDYEVQSFGTQLEFFNDVRHQMADLLEAGVAPDLQTAYDQAIWANSDVREVLLTRRSGGTPVSSRQAKAVGAGIKPSGAVKVTLDDDDSEDSIADTLRKAMSATNGRL